MAPVSGQGENLFEELQPPNHSIATGTEELGLTAVGGRRLGKEGTAVEFCFDLSMGIGEKEEALELGRKILGLDCSRVGTDRPKRKRKRTCTQEKHCVSK
jgi:hypothetical protein